MELNRIQSIQPSSLDLLEAAGITDVEALASVNCDVLHEELLKANEQLQLSDDNLSSNQIAGWVSEAQELIADAPQDAVSEESRHVYNERQPQVAAMLEAAPCALPLPARLLIENKLRVGDIPEGIMLNGYSGELNVGVIHEAPQQSRSGMESLKRAGSVPASTSRDDRSAIMRAPREETNKGRNPNSRWFIRGVLHSSPYRIYFGALVTLLAMLSVPLFYASAALLVLLAEKPEDFDWVPEWVLAFPIALPVFGVAYLLWGLGSGCIVCNQKLFVHRSHLKNSKAHHVPGFGYVLPLCLQIITFRWFRCTHCGTSIRLKE